MKKHGLIQRIRTWRGVKIFILSSTTLGYRELKFFKTKVFLSGLLVGLLSLGTLLIANHYSNDLLGLGYTHMTLLTTENRMLKAQLTTLSEKTESLQQSIDKLADRGNELRLLVDLSTIDKDTRTAGTGGSEESSELSFVSGEANDILNNSQELIAKLTREVELQKTSCEEVYRRYEQNKVLFAHVPAIKPMTGYYSVNDFGMRVHPVLGVIRMHEGIDIVGDVGTAVYAAGDGVVRYSGRTEGGYGSVIEISHGFGYSTLYAHLSKALVRPGQSVKRGDLIGRSGRSGLVSGPHLHYEVMYKGRKVNPVDYFFDDVQAATYQHQLTSRPGDDARKGS